MVNSKATREQTMMTTAQRAGITKALNRQNRRVDALAAKRPGAAPYIERERTTREGNRVTTRLYMDSNGVYRALGRKN
jgi:hypothetical protein